MGSATNDEPLPSRSMVLSTFQGYYSASPRRGDLLLPQQIFFGQGRAWATSQRPGKKPCCRAIGSPGRGSGGDHPDEPAQACGVMLALLRCGLWVPGVMVLDVLLPGEVARWRRADRTAAAGGHHPGRRDDSDRDLRQAPALPWLVVWIAAWPWGFGPVTP